MGRKNPSLVHRGVHRILQVCDSTLVGGSTSAVRHSEKGDVMKEDEGGNARAKGRVRPSMSNRLQDSEGTIKVPSSRERTSSPLVWMQSGKVVSVSGSACGFVPSPKSGILQSLGPNDVGLSKAKDQSHLGLSNMGSPIMSFGPSPSPSVGFVAQAKSPLVRPAKKPPLWVDDEAYKSPSPFRDKGIYPFRNSKFCSLETGVQEEIACRDDISGVNFPHLVEADRYDNNPSARSPSPLFRVFDRPLISGGSSSLGGSFGSNVGNMEPLRIVEADGSEWGMESCVSEVWSLRLLWAKWRRDPRRTIIGQRRDTP